MWAVTHLQYSSLVSRPIDSTIDDSIEHFTTKNFHDCTLRGRSYRVNQKIEKSSARADPIMITIQHKYGEKIIFNLI